MKLNTAFAVGAGQNRVAAALRGGDALYSKCRDDGGTAKNVCFTGYRAVICCQLTTAGAWAGQVRAAEHLTNELIRIAKYAMPCRIALAAEKLSALDTGKG